MASLLAEVKSPVLFTPVLLCYMSIEVMSYKSIGLHCEKLEMHLRTGSKTKPFFFLLLSTICTAYKDIKMMRWCTEINTKGHNSILRILSDEWENKRLEEGRRERKIFPEIVKRKWLNFSPYGFFAKPSFT